MRETQSRSRALYVASLLTSFKIKADFKNDFDSSLHIFCRNPDPLIISSCLFTPTFGGGVQEVSAPPRRIMMLVIKEHPLHPLTMCCICWCKRKETKKQPLLTFFFNPALFLLCLFVTSFQGKCRSHRRGGLHQGLHGRPDSHGTSSRPIHSSIPPCVALSWVFSFVPRRHPCRSTHPGIWRTTSTGSGRFAPMTSTTGTNEPMLSVDLWQHLPSF